MPGGNVSKDSDPASVLLDLIHRVEKLERRAIPTGTIGEFHLSSEFLANILKGNWDFSVLSTTDPSAVGVITDWGDPVTEWIEFDDYPEGKTIQVFAMIVGSANALTTSEVNRGWMRSGVSIDGGSSYSWGNAQYVFSGGATNTRLMGGVGIATVVGVPTGIIRVGAQCEHDSGPTNGNYRFQGGNLFGMWSVVA